MNASILNHEKHCPQTETYSIYSFGVQLAQNSKMNHEQKIILKWKKKQRTNESD